MKLRRTKTTIDAVQTPLEQPPLGDSQPEPDLAALSLDEFISEARHRGFVLVPRAGWDRIMDDLDASAEKIERLTELVSSMSGRSWDEHRRAVLAEQEASTLAQVLVGGEIQALERGTHNDDED